MIDKAKIVEIAEQKLQGTDMFVVECTTSYANDLELIIDSDTSIKIENCIALSRAIEAEFDREEEDFALTVASAGIGSELKLLRQYQKVLGKSVEVLLRDGTKIIAKLDAIENEALTLSYEEKQTIEGKKKKQMVLVTNTYPLEDIKYTKEHLDFK